MNKLNKILKGKLPKHVAIIMDGNGRWAKKSGKDRTYGHINSLQAVRSVIETSLKLGIKYLTLYAFSKENWNRPEGEVNLLMNLLNSVIRDEINGLHKNNIKLNIIGDLSKLSYTHKIDIYSAMELTKYNSSQILTIALSYSSKEELINVMKKLAIKFKEGLIKEKDFNDKTVHKYLYTHDMPMVDLVIRTSGEYRVSNFLLWQIAYAELYFTDILWPDFNSEHFLDAILEYQTRERRFGKTSEQLK